MRCPPKRPTLLGHDYLTTFYDVTKRNLIWLTAGEAYRKIGALTYHCAPGVCFNFAFLGST